MKACDGRSGSRVRLSVAHDRSEHPSLGQHSRTTGQPVYEGSLWTLQEHSRGCMPRLSLDLCNLLVWSHCLTLTVLITEVAQAPSMANHSSHRATEGSTLGSRRDPGTSESSGSIGRSGVPGVHTIPCPTNLQLGSCGLLHVQLRIAQQLLLRSMLFCSLCTNPPRRGSGACRCFVLQMCSRSLLSCMGSWLRDKPHRRHYYGPLWHCTLHLVKASLSDIGVESRCCT
jgi:hypothetical protein